MKQGYCAKATGVFLGNNHLIWCPKRRRKVPVDRVRARLEELIRKPATDVECDILAREILPVHLRVGVSATLLWSPNRLVARCKDKSSRILRQALSFLSRMPSLWTRSRFVAPTGNVAAATIQWCLAAQSTRDA
ncbi:IS200/IS605 family transposase [Chloroflexus sp.]|uniref:IS200/IS605 family transposase n=1 Tax=Chloroflexus sp. TaxID=1904827 RepID=UPI002584CA99|nr:IS200/IS605 family transposase [Chloroflexus sp.]